MRPEKVEIKALFWEDLEKASSPEHTPTFRKVNNLGLLYTYQSKLVEAEQMYQRALQS